MTRQEAVTRLSMIFANCDTEMCKGAYACKYCDEAISMAIEALEQEEIIYCKDCKYWQDNNNGYPVTDCRWNKDETPDADDYCSFAERRAEQ